MNRDSKSRVEKNEFIKDEINVKLGQIKMSGLLYKQSFVKVWMQLVMLSGGDSLDL